MSYSSSQISTNRTIIYLLSVANYSEVYEHSINSNSEVKLQSYH